MIIDFTLSLRGSKEQSHIVEICEHEHCHCDKDGILKSSVKHTLQIFIYIFIITLVLNATIEGIGEKTISYFISNKPVIGPIIASFIGLIPNCASSVVLTELYIENVITMATMISGVLVNAGVGLLVLFRMNKNVKENLKIVIILYLIGVISGIVLELFGV